MRKENTFSAALYCPPEIEEIRLSMTAVLCESIDVFDLPEATFDDTELVF